MLRFPIPAAVRLWVGRSLTALALGFVAWKIVESRAWTLDAARDPRAWGAIAVAATVYAVASLLLSTAWQRILVWLGESEARPVACHRIYARAQIAKYVPGNVVHYVRRQSLGREAGFAHASLLASNVAEGLLGLAACGLLAVAGLIILGPFYPGLSPVRAWGLLALLLAAVVALACAWRIPFVRDRLRLGNLAPRRGGHGLLVQAFGLYAAFLVVVGSLIATLAWLGGAASATAALSVVPVFAVALMAGFLTPGAPAGAGAREAVLVLGATPLLGEAASVVLALGFRLVSTLGDVLFFLAASVGERSRPASVADGSGAA